MKAYRTRGVRIAAIAILMAMAFVLSGVGVLRGRMLLSSVLDGRRERVEEVVRASEFVLRAQMNSQQAQTRAGGWLSVISGEEILISGTRGKLFAECYAPIHEKDDAPWAIVVHGGLGSDSDQVLDIACELSLSGYRVLMPDLYAHGRSEGKWTSLGLREAEDIQSCVEWIVAEDKDAQIVIFGQDEGAVAVLLAASGGLHAAVKAIAADSAYMSVRDRAHQLLDERFGGKIDMWLFDAAYRAAHGVSLDDGEVLDKIDRICVPLLLIHGTGDQDVPAWHSEDLALAAGQRAELLYIEGAPHGLARFCDPKTYKEHMHVFFAEALSDFQS